LHAPPAAAAATAAAATWLTTATIANQIKQLSCYEQKRGRLGPHQVARLTNKRELGVNPGIQGSAPPRSPGPPGPPGSPGSQSPSRHQGQLSAWARCFNNRIAR